MALPAILIKGGTVAATKIAAVTKAALVSKGFKTTVIGGIPRYSSKFKNKEKRGRKIVIVVDDRSIRQNYGNKKKKKGGNR